MFLMLRHAQESYDLCAFVSLRDQNVCAVNVLSAGSTASQLERKCPVFPLEIYVTFKPEKSMFLCSLLQPQSPSDEVYFVGAEMNELLDL